MPPQDKATGRSEGEQKLTAPSISLPKGGGAIRGMGEKFAANLVTGSGSMTVPIATSPGRAGFGPQLSLSHDSGAGNGPFGFGWSLNLPAITRKTDKGLPTYHDAGESDVFILSGTEDLVPVLVQNGEDWEPEALPPRTVGGSTYQIQRYRPRVEGLFARIERWTNLGSPQDVFWRSISKDNITTFYGRTAESRIADPAEPTRIFSWLICQSYDDKGKAIVYRYEQENSDGLDLRQAHEKNRTATSRSANRYLKSVQYGNRRPNRDTDWVATDPAQLPDSEWMFEVVFDYGEHDRAAPLPKEPGGSWSVRNDPFSSYRAGFELRTYRLCQRVLMFHHFPDEQDIGRDCLVRSTDFTYSHEENPADARNPIFSFLLSVTQAGYRRSQGGYLKKTMPPLEFEYSKPTIDETVREIDLASLENLPNGLDNERYQWVDLDGEGLSGILTEQTEGWFYKRNLSPIGGRQGNGDGVVTASFAPIELVAQKPSLAGLRGRQQLLDLAGDGQLDLVQLDGPTPGFFERTEDDRWNSLVPFSSLPNLGWDDPNLRFVDLTGDGHADVLISEDEAFYWHPSLAEAGFGPPERVRKVLEEEQGPRILFADGTESIYLSDMSGDGLTDLVRIRNGEVCYWPNLGYGRFGAKVTMDNSPWFDGPELFDQRRIRLADIDGSGVVDILYLGLHGVQAYFNQSGNSWSAPTHLTGVPATDNVKSVTVVDLLGNGTACLVWSSPLSGDMRRPMRYLDLMGGQKPHLLIKQVNNLGAETHVQYAPSTKFYLADKLAGKPWVTRLPFPVHVVERIETHDRISGNRFVTRHSYHHGYFEGAEREFRGFGMVEQRDTEEIAALAAGGTLPDATNIDEGTLVPPVLTRTWFHTGVHLGRQRVSSFFAGLIDERDAGEYYREPGLSDAQARQLLLDDTVLPDGLTAEEEEEACRTLKGSMLRQEVYALDGSEREAHPYTVTEQNFTLRRFQPRAVNRHAVFFFHAREALSYHYERNPADPRISHSMTLEVDGFGNVLKSASIGYGRRQPDPTLSPEDQARQAAVFVTYEESAVTNAIESDDDYRTPLPSESCTHELTGLVPQGNVPRFSLAQLLLAGASASPIPYEQSPTAGVLQKRAIEHVRTHYRPDDFGASQSDPLALLPLGMAEPLSLRGESYKLAFTPGLLARVFRRPLDQIQPPGSPPPENLLPDPGAVLPIEVLDGGTEDRGGYVDLDGDGHWWIPSGRTFLSPGTDEAAGEEGAYARRHFFLPLRYRDPFARTTTVTHDRYDLLTIETQDPLGNRVTAGERDVNGNLSVADNDYRVLAPRQVMDPNRNRSAVAYDALGMVVGTALKGNPEQILGDSLAGFEPDLADSTILDHLANPFADPHSILARATTRLVYDLFAYHRTKAKAAPQPAVIYTMVRETHDTDLEAGLKTKIQHSFSYSDGFGRDIQKKIQAEPGPVPKRDGAGEIILGPAGLPEMTSGDTDPRWVGSGWTIFNNKGKPVRQYEPFFTDTHGLDFDVRIGVSPVLFYDPAQRVIATLRPNKTWEKVVFDPWRQESWDVNDTVLVADPGTDPDVGAYFRRLSQAEYLPTWFAQRQGGALSSEEQASAAKAAVHAGTPLVAHVDSLARTFMTVTHNKFKYSDAAPVDPPIEEFHRTRLLFDIKGNQREVIDANDRLAIRYDYDMLGSRIHQASMEAGERWILNDVLGNPLYAWDGRGHRFRTVSDQLRRPAASFLSQGDGAELLVGRSEYGEARANPEMNNLRGKLVRIFDQAGIITSENYDFKGNLLRSTRQLALEYKATLDWSAPVPLKAEVFVDTSRFDALNRPIERVTPDGSVIHNAFNEANLLERVDANLRGDALASAFVTGVEYDAMGQRTSVEYGNGVRRIYELDQLTHRLAHTRTLRGGVQLQDLSYSYDPAGNITSIRDDGQQTIYFNGQVVEAHNDYIYDSLYRLIDAKGREHIGQLGRPEFTWDDHFRVRLPHPNDGQAMRRYTEQYRYDAVGNFLHLIHLAMNGNWSRSYAYDAPSLLEPDKAGNRLSSTSSGSTSPVSEFYSHDVHGNMNTMPHLALMQWDFRDQLQRTARQVVSHGSPETTYHVYDASGERVRKVTERQNGTRKKERTYLDGFEVYREFDGAGSGVALERETLHLSDDHQRIVLVETRTQGSDGSPVQLQRFQLGSHLGSASLELDEQGQVISFEEYTPYGSTSYQAVDSQTEAPKRYRYTGTERDEETGLNYHGARYYVPWLGRWLSADPIGLNGGINLFSYARGDPIGHSDTNGFEPDKGSYESRLNAVKSVVARSDRNFDRRITGKELFDAIQCSTVPFADFQEFGLMAAGGYRLDPLAASILSPPPPRFPSSEELQRRQEQNENLLRAGSDGINYTRRERREAGEKWLNRHRDPKRLLATVEFGAATLAPQYYFPAKSIYHSATGDPEQASLALAQGLLARFWGGSSTPKPSPQGGGAARALGGPAHESVNRWVPQSIRGGGRLWVSRGPVTGSGIKRLIARAGRSGRQTTILSGTHGDTYGRIGPSAEFDPRNLLTVGESTGGEFLIDDISVLAGRGHAPGVRVMDVTRMSERELDIALSGGGDIYAAWCHSALSCAIGRAFNRINARP